MSESVLVLQKPLWQDLDRQWQITPENRRESELHEGTGQLLGHHGGDSRPPGRPMCINDLNIVVNQVGIGICASEGPVQ